MRAHLVLKSPDGVSGNANAIPTAATIKNFMASPETVQKAARVAEQLGFEVINTTPLQVTIEGPQQLFERVFSSSLKSALSVEKGSGISDDPSGSIGPASASSDLHAWSKPPKLPVEFEKIATDIALPQTIAIHG